MAPEIKKFYDQLSSSQRWVLAIVGAPILILPMTFFLMFGRSAYLPIISDVPPADMTRIVELAEKSGVEYKLSADGTSLFVPEQDIPQLRMQMSSAGLPGYGHVGLEIFSDSDYGRSDFSQKVNYMRAMQGELARTIMALPEVRDARVHLVLPEKTLFASQQEKASASITLIESAPEAVTIEQVAGIQRLVAAAIRGMQAENVVVLTDQGMLLSRATGSDEGGIAAGAERERESQIENKIRKVISSYLKRDDFVVSVSVSMDEEKYQVRTEEPVQPSQEPVIRAHKVQTRSDQQDGSERQSGSKKSTRDEETSYAVGTRIEERDVDKRVITRIAVAVVLPEETSMVQRSDVQSLVAFAAGLDESRGDQAFVSMRGVATPPDAVEKLSVIAPMPGKSLVDLRWWHVCAAALASFLLSALLFLRWSGGKRLGERDRKALAGELEAWLATARGASDV